MRLRADFDSLSDLLAREVKAGETAVHRSIRAAGAALKESWRAQVRAAGLGSRLANTVREKTWPEGRASLNAASLVWSRAPVILGAFSAGALIRAVRGLYLAIPTEYAGRGRGGRSITPAEWERRHKQELVFVRRPGQNPMLFAVMRESAKVPGRFRPSRAKTRRGQVSLPIFTLVPQVSLRRRLDLEAPANRALAGLPGAIERNWSRMK